MRSTPFTHKAIAALALCALAGSASATLPPPTPAQAQAAAAKKAAAAEQAAKEKQELLASEDAITARWRSRAAAQGWHTNAAVPVAAPAAALGTPASGNAPAGQPGGKQSATAASLPIRSEKQGTAPPSKDVKKKP